MKIFFLVTFMLTSCTPIYDIGINYDLPISNKVINNEINKFKKNEAISYIKNEKLKTDIAKCYIYKLAKHVAIDSCSSVIEFYKEPCFNKSKTDEESIYNCTHLFNMSRMVENENLERKTYNILIKKTHSSTHNRIYNKMNGGLLIPKSLVKLKEINIFCKKNYFRKNRKSESRDIERKLARLCWF